MASTQETLIRQWTMLRMVPRYPQKITARELTERLETESFQVSKRTVERDLLGLSAVFPLTLDSREKPYGWSWQRDAASFDLPGLSDNEALTLMMVEQHLIGLLPASTLQVLSPYFNASRRHLGHIPSAHKVTSWANKVRTVIPNQTLHPAKIKPEIHQVVSEALLEDRQLAIDYRRKGDDSCVKYRIHPIALVQRGGVNYLVVRIYDYQDIRNLAMHRIESALKLDLPSEPPNGFDIDAEITKGSLSFGGGGIIRLEAIFSPVSGEHLLETPLSDDQEVHQGEDGRLFLKATVADTPQLFWWLLAMGDGVEVVTPLSLRSKIIKTVNSMAEKYK